jgi:hypothetical protein
MHQVWEAEIGTRARHGLGERVHLPSGGVVRWLFGHQLHQQQDIVVTVDMRTTGSVLVAQPH